MSVNGKYKRRSDVTWSSLGLRNYLVANALAEIRWILNIVHNPEHTIYLDLWYYDVLRSRGMSSINDMWATI